MTVNRKALVWGTGVFVVLYGIHLLLLPVLVGTEPGGKSDSLLYGIHQLLGIATCLAAGFVAGRIAGERGFAYGFGVGMAGTVVTALASLLWALVSGARSPLVATLPFWVLVNGFLAAFAGWFGSGAETVAPGDTGGRPDGGLDA